MDAAVTMVYCPWVFALMDMGNLGVDSVRTDCVKEPLLVQFGILSEIQKEQPPESPRVVQLSVCLHVPGFLPGWSGQAEITVGEIRSEESERCSKRVSLVRNSEAFVERKGKELHSPHRVENGHSSP